MRVVRFVLSAVMVAALSITAHSQTVMSGDVPPAEPPSWKQIGPWGGECWEIFLHPTDPQIVFAVGPAGIHKSTDHGDNWRPVYTPEMTGYFLSMAFMAGEPDTIIAGGTGTGVWRSEDGGETWTRFNQGLPGGDDDPPDLASLACTSEGTFWLGTRHGDRDGFVYRLESGRWVLADAGLMLNPPVVEPEPDPMEAILKAKEEQEAADKPKDEAETDEEEAEPAAEPVENPNPHATQLEVDANGRLWAGVYGGGIFRLDGDAWMLLTTGGQGNMMPTSLVALHDRAKTFYFGTQEDWIWYTITDGKYWKRMKPLDTSIKGALPMVNFIAIDPVNPKLLWAGFSSYDPNQQCPLFEPLPGQEGGGVAISQSKGENWYHIWHASHGFWNNMTLVPGKSVTDWFAERAANVWVTYDGFAGILYSDLGERELDRRYRGFNGEEVYSILLDSDGRFYAGTGDGLNQPDEEWGWVYRDITTRYAFLCDMTEDFSKPGRVVYCFGGTAEPGKPDHRGIFRTGVFRWYPLLWPRAAKAGTRTMGIYRIDDPERLLEETPCWTVATSPAAPQTIWAGTQTKGVLVSRDGGAKWSDVNWGLPENASVTSLVLDFEGGARFAGLRESDGAEWNGREWRAYEGEKGSCWTYDEPRLTWRRMEGLDDAVYRLEWTPVEGEPGGGRLRAATSGGLFEWDFESGAWSDLTPGLPEKVVTCLAVPQSAPDTIFAGTATHGVWVSRDGGITWEEFNKGLLKRDTWRLLVDPEDPDHVWVATLGGGVFECGEKSPEPSTESDIDPE